MFRLSAHLSCIIVARFELELFTAVVHVVCVYKKSQELCFFYEISVSVPDAFARWFMTISLFVFLPTCHHSLLRASVRALWEMEFFEFFNVLMPVDEFIETLKRFNLIFTFHCARLLPFPCDANPTQANKPCMNPSLLKMLEIRKINFKNIADDDDEKYLTIRVSNYKVFPPLLTHQNYFNLFLLRNESQVEMIQNSNNI